MRIFKLEKFFKETIMVENGIGTETITIVRVIIIIITTIRTIIEITITDIMIETTIETIM